MTVHGKYTIKYRSGHYSVRTLLFAGEKSARIKQEQGEPFCQGVVDSTSLALPLAEALGRIFKPWRWLLYFLAGFVGIWAACELANYVLPMPTFIAATRETPGLLSLMAAVGLGSALFGRLTKPKARRGLRVLG